MQITLYKNLSDSKVLNKDIEAESRPSHEVKNIQLFEPANVLQPTFAIDAFNGVEDFNYLYFDKFKRYYYCTVTLENHKAILSCTVDPLMSHRTAISNLECFITRNEFTYNDMLVDNNVSIKSKRKYTVKNFDESEKVVSTENFIIGVIK